MPKMCDVGRRIPGDYPCPYAAVHGIQSPELPPVFLCDTHFHEVAVLGLVTEPGIGKEEFDRRESVRLAAAQPERPANG